MYRFFFLPRVPYQGWREEEVCQPGLDRGAHERPPAQHVGLHVSGAEHVGAPCYLLYFSQIYSRVETHKYSALVTVFIYLDLKYDFFDTWWQRS